MRSGSRRSPDGVCLRLKLGMEPGSHRSPGEVYLHLKSVAKSGSLRSPNEVYLRLKLEAKSGSHRSPDGVFLRSKSRAKSGSRRSPDRVLLRRGRWEGPPFSHLVLNDQTLIGVRARFFSYFCRNMFQLWLGRGSPPVPNAAVGAHMALLGPSPHPV